MLKRSEWTGYHPWCSLMDRLSCAIWTHCGDLRLQLMLGLEARLQDRLGHLVDDQVMEDLQC